MECTKKAAHNFLLKIEKCFTIGNQIKISSQFKLKKWYIKNWDCTFVNNSLEKIIFIVNNQK